MQIVLQIPFSAKRTMYSTLPLLLTPSLDVKLTRTLVVKPSRLYMWRHRTRKETEMRTPYPQ